MACNVLLVIGSVLLCSIGVGCNSAAAQTPPPNSAARRTALRSVTQACAQDYARHCAVPASGTVGARSEVICLKFVKQDLTLACRRAVIAAAP